MTFFKKLKYSRFTILYYFQVCNTVIQYFIDYTPFKVTIQ